MTSPDLFVGITSWNSELFLGHCLRHLQACTAGVSKRVVVLDNGSEDASARIASELGVEVVISKCSQAAALNQLTAMSRSPYTLLLHSDVILISPKWFDLCLAGLSEKVALVSPEDIGCGPYTREFGVGYPESSFMFFDTAALRSTRITMWPRWHRLPYPQRSIDFYGDHITHRLPARLAARGYSWCPMGVHVSDTLAAPIYTPAFKPRTWTDELRFLRYGLGNFYSLGGHITHYHNWYDRLPRGVDPASSRTAGPDGTGFPLAYIRQYTENFLADLARNELVIPAATPTLRRPKAL